MATYALKESVRACRPRYLRVVIGAPKVPVRCSVRRGTTAFTLLEIMIVVAIVGMLAAVAIPSYVRARANSWQSLCIDNLRQIDNAKQTWALEHQVDPTGIPMDSDIQPYMGRGGTGTLPCCPADTNANFDTSYSLNNLQIAPTCLIVPVTHLYK
jgi:prepilin-type N-terminal cleavage/methylation domain-containing protein